MVRVCLTHFETLTYLLYSNIWVRREKAWCAKSFVNTLLTVCMTVLHCLHDNEIEAGNVM